MVSKPTDLDHAYENKVCKHGRRGTGCKGVESSWESNGSDVVAIGDGSDSWPNGVAAAIVEIDRCQQCEAPGNLGSYVATVPASEG